MLCFFFEIISHPLSHIINPNSICPVFGAHTKFPEQKKEPWPGTQQPSHAPRQHFPPHTVRRGYLQDPALPHGLMCDTMICAFICLPSAPQGRLGAVFILESIQSRALGNNQHASDPIKILPRKWGEWAGLASQVCDPWSHTGPANQKGLVLGVMLCCHQLEILNNIF